MTPDVLALPGHKGGFDMTDLLDGAVVTPVVPSVDAVVELVVAA